jgi:hypothetical protein
MQGMSDSGTFRNLRSSLTMSAVGVKRTCGASAASSEFDPKLASTYWVRDFVRQLMAIAV